MRLPFHLFTVAAGFRASVSVRSSGGDATESVIETVTENPNDIPGLEPQCQCSETGEGTGKAGCGFHFGRRIGYMCYIAGGDECDGAKKGRTGQYYRLCPVERKRDVAREKLYESMEGIDADLVAQLAKDAKAALVDKDTLQAAADRVDEIGEMLEIRAELMEALTAFDKKKLKNLAEQAEEHELFEFMDHDIPELIEERLEFLATKDEKEEKLLKAVKGIDLEELRESIKKAIEVRADDAVVDKGKKREEELLEERAEIKAELKKALEGWDKKTLEKFADKAEKHKLFGELPRNYRDKIEKRVEFLGSAGKKEAHLRMAMQGVDLKSLQDAIKDVEAVRSNADLVDKAKQRETELIGERKSAREELDAALTDFDIARMSAALDEAKRLKIATDDDKDTAKGRTEYLEIMEDDSLGALLRAIAEATAKKRYDDITVKAHLRIKELRTAMHKQKVKVRKLVSDSDDPDEIERELEEGLRIRAVGRGLRIEAEERIAELRAR